MEHEIALDLHLLQHPRDRDSRSVVSVLCKPRHRQRADVERTAHEVLPVLDLVGQAFPAEERNVVVRAPHREEEPVARATPLDEARSHFVEPGLVRHHLLRDACDLGDVRSDFELRRTDQLRELVDDLQGAPVEPDGTDVDDVRPLDRVRIPIRRRRFQIQHDDVGRVPHVALLPGTVGGATIGATASPGPGPASVSRHWSS